MSVPPVIVSLCVLFANMHGSSIACSRSVMLPAVPMSISMFFALICPGINSSSLLPISAPSAFAVVSCCSAFMQVTCCAFSPGSGLVSLMFFILNGFPVSVLSASAVLTICPPPSIPSKFIILFRSSCVFKRLSKKIKNKNLV